jgi:hypothetical protein
MPMDTATRFRILSNCARREICHYVIAESCIASTTISIDVLQQYGRSGSPWEACDRIQALLHFHLEPDCASSASLNAAGGHLIVLVQEAFLLDSLLAQITDSFPEILVPPAFAGQLSPSGSSLRDHYTFVLLGAHKHYSAQAVDRFLPVPRLGEEQPFVSEVFRQSQLGQASAAREASRYCYSVRPHNHMWHKCGQQLNCEAQHSLQTH